MNTLLSWLPHRFLSPQLRLLLTDILAHRRRAVLAIALMLLGAAIGSGKFALLERLLSAGGDASLARLGWLMVATAACWGAGELCLMLSTNIGYQLDERVSTRVISRALQPLLLGSHTRSVEANVLVEHVRGGLAAVGRATRGLFAAGGQLAIVVCNGAMALYLQPLLAVVSLAVSVLALRLAARYIQRQRCGAEEMRAAELQLQHKLTHFLEALPQVKIYGAGSQQFERLCAPLQRLKHGDRTLRASQRRGMLLLDLFGAVGCLLLLGLAPVLLHYQLATVAACTACIVLHQMLFIGLRRLLAQWALAEENSPILATLQQLDAEAALAPSAGQALGQAIATIECRAAALRVGQTVLLRDVACTLRRGKLYGVAGPSGAGKTLLLQLLQGGSRLGTGEMLVNGRDLLELQREDLLQRVALVVWPPLLLEGVSLAENLRLAQPQGSGAELRAVLTAVAFDRDLDQLAPVGGLDAVLGRSGVQLSVGQLQRLSLARALLRAPEVLLVDDLLTGLDPFSTRRVLRSLRAFAQSHLVVLVVSSEATLRCCDEVLLLRDGRLVAQLQHPSELAEEFLANQSMVGEAALTSYPQCSTVATSHPASAPAECGALAGAAR